MYQIFHLSVSRNLPLANANNLKQSLSQKQEISVQSSQIRSVKEVNIYLKVCGNEAQILLVKPAGTITSESSHS